MGSNHVEVESFINLATVEAAYTLGTRCQQARRQSFADTGLRAARARDPKLLKALEKGAEVLRALSERQLGASYTTSTGVRVDATEYNLWKAACECVDKGEPIKNLEWIYGMAAWLCGYNS